MVSRDAKYHKDLYDAAYLAWRREPSAETAERLDRAYEALRLARQDESARMRLAPSNPQAEKPKQQLEEDPPVVSRRRRLNPPRKLRSKRELQTVTPEEALEVSKWLEVRYEDAGDGWTLATIPEIPGAISQGRTREEARENVLEALRVMLSSDDKDGGQDGSVGR